MTLTDVEEGKELLELRQSFTAHFGAAPDFVARAPGRINLIGEHTDYNGGFVLPVAINRAMLIAVRAVTLGKGQLELFSRNYNATTSFDLDKIEPAPYEALAWSNYVRGVAAALTEKGLLDLKQVGSAQFMLEGQVPLGAGLSSSAALEVATALALFTLAGFEPSKIDRVALALACQRAENDFVGVKTGIMDQFVSALGQPDAALLIDTRSLEYRAIPLGFRDLRLKLVAVDSAIPHSLKTSAYNERYGQCKEAAHLLAKHFNLPENSQLRDFTVAQLEAATAILPPLLFQRARHVLTENERVLQAVALLDEGLGKPTHLQAFGSLLNQSHASLRDDYEVSTPDVDLLVELAQQHPGVIGSRLTGGGFGGCTVNVVAEEALESFGLKVVEEYRRRTGLEAKMYLLEGVEGGSILR